MVAVDLRGVSIVFFKSNLVDASNIPQNVIPFPFAFITFEFLLFKTERDAFDTLLDHAPDKLNVVKTV